MEARRLLAEAAPHAEIDVVPPRALLSMPRCRQLGIAGQPPDEEIGAALAVLAVLRCRPRVVTLIDPRNGAVRSIGAARYLASALPWSTAQVVVSGLGVGLQRALASAPLGGGAGGASSTLRRVLYLRPFVGLPESVGGSITHAHGVIRGLGELGIDVVPFTTDRSIVEAARRDPEPPCSWRLVSLPRPFRAIPASAALGGDLSLVTAALSEAMRADLIYQRHSRFSLAGALLARLTGRPLFLEYNHSEVFFERWMPTPLSSQLARCERASLRAATRVLVSSEAHRRQVSADAIPPDRIVVNPNGVDVSRFMRGGGADLRRELGLEPAQLVIGFVGSFGPWHGVPVLARAFAGLAAVLPNARLVLVGAGPEHDAVRAVLDGNGVAERAVFAGRVAPAQIASYLDACDILVSPHVELPGGTEFFGSPTKLFEYMAAAKAIVASRLGQIGDVLEHERSALLVRPGDADELRAALVRFARDPELRARAGAEARRAAADRHTWRANADRVVAAYEGLTSGESPRRPPGPPPRTRISR